MVSLSHLFILLLSTSLFLFFLRKWRCRHAPAPSKRPPPSPMKLPVIGNLHQLGLYPHKSLRSQSQRYGPLMQLHLGSVPVVIASSPEAAREIMKTQDLAFSNRPKMTIPQQMFYGGRDVAFAPYGNHWRQMRSICVLQLLSNKRVQSFRRVREEETSLMVEKIMQSTSAVNLTEMLMSLTNDVICRASLGKKYAAEDGEERKWKKLMGELTVLAAVMPLWEYIPLLEWTRRFDSVERRIATISGIFDELLEKVIEEHRANEKDGDGVGLDFVDILLQFQRENKSSSPVDDLTIKAMILEMFLAGSDTSATVPNWALAELIKNPRTMKALQNEVREVAGSKPEIEEEDLAKMPYLKALIKETLRLHTPVPLLVPRESTQDTNVLGYDIPSGTRVMINVWAICRDPSLWEKPEEFIPERFLDTSIDYKGLHFEFLPFGAGRRVCPGLAFAAAIGELALAKLVHKFDFGLPNGAKVEELDMSESIGLTIHRKFPLLVVANPHSS